jgi:hypothetical protein
MAWLCYGDAGPGYGPREQPASATTKTRLAAVCGVHLSNVLIDLAATADGIELV